jgi:hypothetical protein
MASIAPPMGWKARAMGVFTASIAWFVPMALTSGVAAYTAYFYTQKANTQLVIQQQSLGDLQQFRASGAAFDQAVGNLSDALVDGANITASQRDMRAAITRSISDTLAVRHLLGDSEADAYIKGLANLRETVDGIKSFDAGQKLWQDSLNLMSTRRKLIGAAEKRALRGEAQ